MIKTFVDQKAAGSLYKSATNLRRDSVNIYRSHALRSSLYTPLSNRHPGRDCRDPVAMDGNRSDHYNSHDKHSTILYVHPCTLDPLQSMPG